MMIRYHFCKALFSVVNSKLLPNDLLYFRSEIVSRNCNARNWIFKRFFREGFLKTSFEETYSYCEVSSRNNSTVCLDNQKLEQYLRNLNIESLKSNHDLSNDHIFCYLLREKNKLEENLNQLKVLEVNEENSKNQKELLELINEDIKQYTTDLKDIYEKIVACLLPAEDFQNCNEIVLEISAGVGGLEAMLFASNLQKMYCHFLDYKGWQYCLAESDGSELGGVRHCSLLVSGPEAYSTLQHEAGVHRVQRVPVTEKGGRVHTSTVTVAVLPQPSEIEVNLKEVDLKIETKKASGAGGQHVNTTESAVRIVHIPTGIAVECQTGRSQIQNKATALKRLQAKIYEKELSQMDSNVRTQRKLQVGTSGRSEKIRTYNFRDDRISDHRLTVNVHNLKEFLSGGEPLDNLLGELSRWHYNLRVQKFVDSL